MTLNKFAALVVAGVLALVGTVYAASSFVSSVFDSATQSQRIVAKLR